MVFHFCAPKKIKILGPACVHQIALAQMAFQFCAPKKTPLNLEPTCVQMFAFAFFIMAPVLVAQLVECPLRGVGGRPRAITYKNC